MQTTLLQKNSFKSNCEEAYKLKIQKKGEAKVPQYEPRSISISFRSNKERKEQWVEKTRCKNWQPSKSSVACSDHFMESDID